MQNKATHVIVHHTEVDTKYSQFPAVEKYHKSKGFPISSLGFHVGYHKMIDKKGKIITARKDTDEGAHTLGGWNRSSIGICLDGNFNENAPTKLQIVALKSLLKKYGLPYMLHREADENRTCPGILFTRDLLKDKLPPQEVIKEEKEKMEGIKAQISLISILIQALQSLFNALTKRSN